MADYVDLVTTEKKYISNVVIKIGATYFCTRQPDTGLSVSSPYDKMVVSLNLNPVAADIKKANTSIAGFSFRLLDKDGVVSALIAGTGAALLIEDVTIWLGRSRKTSSAAAHDFSGYFQLPITRIKKIGHDDNTYTFSTAEEADKMGRPIFAATSALGVAITSGTTTITMRDSIAAFPSAGRVRVQNEIFSYTSKSATEFLGVIRGEDGTTPAAHEINTNCFHSQTITGNPLDILLKILISNGGGGTYDVLTDGLGISNALVDVAGIEAIRDAQFLTTEIKLEISNAPSALKFIEAEILQFFNLRFTYSSGSLLTLAVLDKAVFVPVEDTVTEAAMITYPKWSVDDTKIVNKVKISWDYDEPTAKFLRYTELTDAASIASYDLRPPLTFSFKGVKEDLGGEALVTEFARVLFARFGTPVAEVEVKLQMDKSLKNIGSQVYIESSKIPSPAGGLAFNAIMEMTKRSINYQLGEVSATFSFTSSTRLRPGFVAPSDLITYIETQKKVGITNGRSAKYRVGWYMRLWNELTQAYEADAPNRIARITTDNNLILQENGFELLAEDGTNLLYDQAPRDLIFFDDNFATTLTVNHRLRFANYGEVAENQKRYCFISDNGNNFADGKSTYKVVY